METLHLDGKEYVKAAVAAEKTGYTTDYVGQLCRAGKLDSHLIGRSWYVNIDELGSHRSHAKRAVRVKAREQVRKAIEEQKRLEEERAREKALERRIKYEEDDTELIPHLRKVEEGEKIVEHDAVKGNLKRLYNDPKAKYIVENEGEKIVMKGELEVFDVTEGEEEDKDTTVLQPEIKKISKKEYEKNIQELKQRGLRTLPTKGGKYLDIAGNTTKNKDISEEPVVVNTTFLSKLDDDDLSTLENVLFQSGKKAKRDESPKEVLGTSRPKPKIGEHHVEEPKVKDIQKEVDDDEPHFVDIQKNQTSFMGRIVGKVRSLRNVKGLKKGSVVGAAATAGMLILALIGFSLVLESTWTYAGKLDSERGIFFKSSYRANVSSFLDRVREEL